MAAGDRPADAAATAAVYSAEMTRRTYERLADLSRTVLTAGWVAVVDAACLQRWQRGILADAAGRAGADLVWLDLDVPAAVAIGRVQSRAGGDDPSDATAQVVAGQLADRDPITAAEIAGTGPAHPGGTHPGITVVRVGADQPRDPAAVAAIVAQFPGAATREP
jgi:predicted kinase